MADFQEFCVEIGLALEPFQELIADAAAGSERELVVLLPRGQGKTTLLAAIALHHLVTVERPAIYVAASSRDQARVLFESASGFARVLEDEHLVDRHLELRYCPDAARPRVFTGALRVLAADAPRLHGLTPSLAIIDELHAHPNDAVYIAMRTALAKRPGSRLIVISSAGAGADTPLATLRARAFAQPDVIRRGSLTDARGPNLRLLEWSVPEDTDIDDPEVVKEANPASWVTVDDLARQHEALPASAYARYHCNQWVEREGHWLPAGAWQACEGTPTFEAGERIWIGVDIGGTRSTSAVAWINEAHHVGCEIHHGDGGVLDCVDLIRELAGRYELREVMFDPWRFGQAAQELEQQRIVVTAFPQTDVRMVPASLRLYEAVVQQRLTLPDNEELRRHMANTIAKHGRRGWRLDKPSLDQPNDGIIALAMALEALENQPAATKLVGWV